MTDTPPTVRIHYKRPPEREDLFTQRLVRATPGCIITYQPSTPIRADLVVQGRVVLQPGSPVVWFTFPGAWHDVGRFHLLDGSFTGLYANILTPIRVHGPHEWETTDLYLDVWIGNDGTSVILDEEEFAEAVARAWIDGATTVAARREAEALLASARLATFPPRVVKAWTLERVTAALQQTSA